ncbi:uncharacterized protein Nmag_0852 [Natrialba magadii ATCC 43099]|uniref:Uncharacterized protein n=1 Tax=Natrialba magadii (strain ATCC 43099 / DSM 3394 / CCM 3739 / CIP 104546 / IAM 13178 / JCM 8861 / NBRC 102185 / NCIMB 2190 / MS3) TaxID=547559 RepID=D3T078_NATMM|nr:hypothetical protein [Natrialba magadii]ADD04436.1 uncharacterized protein Nmag_0852 [Natrialba magadii ATCC 43099]ELY25832.1 hypothetical protein C500_16779 [Natrialba magadii ATCC 43099]
MARKREACGRCSMSVAVEAAQSEQSDRDRADRDPYGEARIEVEESALRRLSPDGWLSGLSTRVSERVRQLTWGN